MAPPFRPARRRSKHARARVLPNCDFILTAQRLINEQPRGSAGSARPISSKPSERRIPKSSVCRAITDQTLAKSNTRIKPVSPSATSWPVSGEIICTRAQVKPKSPTALWVGVGWCLVFGVWSLEFGVCRPVVGLGTQFAHAVLANDVRRRNAEASRQIFVQVRFRQSAGATFVSAGFQSARSVG